MSAMAARLAAGMLAVGAVVGLGALSQVPYPPGEPAEAVVRLAWRVRSHRLEECRRLTPAELAKLPPHMRREEVCEGRLLPYRLRVVLDGQTVVDEETRPAGARGDRPLYVYHEIPVSPGERMVEVEFVRADGGEPEETRGDEDREETTGSGESIAVQGAVTREAPALLQFARRLTLDGGQVALITYDPETRQLVALGYGVVP